LELEEGRLGLNQEMTSEETEILSSSDEDEEEEEGGLGYSSADSTNSPHYRDSIISLASVVVHRLRTTHPHIAGDPSLSLPAALPSWLRAHAKSDTAVPSEAFSEQAMKMDAIFVQQHGLKVDMGSGVTRRFVERVAEQVPEIDRYKN
jgi:hypothetical protein